MKEGYILTCGCTIENQKELDGYLRQHIKRSSLEISKRYERFLVITGELPNG